jgi:hypothetical protein
VGGRTVESFLSQYSDSRDLLASHVSSITIYFNLHPMDICVSGSMPSMKL